MRKPEAALLRPVLVGVRAFFIWSALSGVTPAAPPGTALRADEPGMLHLDAAVHDHLESGGAGALRRRLVDHR